MGDKAKINCVRVLEYDVYCGNIDSIDISTQTVVNTINAHSYCLAKYDSEFYKALISSDILLADGVGIVLAAEFLEKKQIPRITGSDIFNHYLSLLDECGGKCFFLGSTTDILYKITERMSKDYPSIYVETYSPPFKDVFDQTDQQNIIDAINKFSPDVLFVGMGAPKQEKWVYNNLTNIGVRVICSIGAVFDFYSAEKPRAPKLFRDYGLEWLHRSITEPGRLGRRNLISIPLFLKEIIVAKWFK